MVEPNVYEVRCERCRTSFAAGTKRCVHCGERIGGWRPLMPPEPDASGVVIEHRPEPMGEEEMPEVPTRARAVLWIVTALLALAGSLFRTCQ